MSKYKEYPALIYISLSLLYVFAIFNVEPIFSEPDAGWHLAAGDYIRAHGLPITDPWAFTSGGVPWYDLSYGFDVLISIIYSVAGFGGLYIFMLVTLTCVGCVCAMHCRARGVSVPVTALVVFCAGVALTPSVFLRPQLVTYLLIAVLHYVLYLDSIKPSKKAWIIFPLLTLLWSNLHGGVIAVFITAGCYALQNLVRKEFKQFQRAIGIGVLCGVCALITPYGFHIFYAMSVSIISVMNANIVEWQYLVPFLLWEQGAFFIFFIVVSNLKQSDTPLADKIAVFLWLIFALRSRRHFPIFVILSVPYVAQCLEGVIKKNQWPEKIQKMSLGHKAFHSVLVLAIAGSALMCSFIYVSLADQYRYLRQSRAMTQAVEYVAEKYPNARVFNRFNDGGHLIWLAKERFKISIDGRIDTAYPQEYMHEFVTKIDSAEEGWMDVVQKYESDLFLLPEGSKLEKSLHEFKGDWFWEQTFEEGEGRYSDVKYYVIVKKSLYDIKQQKTH